MAISGFGEFGKRNEKHRDLPQRKGENIRNFEAWQKLMDSIILVIIYSIYIYQLYIVISIYIYIINHIFHTSRTFFPVPWQMAIQRQGSSWLTGSSPQTATCLAFVQLFAFQTSGELNKKNQELWRAFSNMNHWYPLVVVRLLEVDIHTNTLSG